MIRILRRKIGKPVEVIGLISDTHGLVRPQALDALRGVDLLIHAGDIGKAEVLDALEPIAPLHAIKGNNDHGAWAKKLPGTMILTVGGVRLYLIHDVHELSFEPSKDGIATVISGHSHKPSIIERAGVLFVNPGSAGPRRFKLPVAVGKLRIADGKLKAEIIELDI
ncbi:MAG TPA: metallophosphoesterase family protein [Candidatus Binatia bacterium]|nr:metallophosphoesterase family protein [Candidatus Binatia bacterium]